MEESVSTTIIFETHSLSEDNERGIATGWLDGRLSARGRDLARELGVRRGNDGIDVVFTSDLGRGVETATLAFYGSGLSVIEDPRLRECNYGDLNGSSVECVHAVRSQYIDNPFPNGQSYRQVVEQMRGLLADVACRYGDKRVLFIGHSATKWSLDHLLEGRDLRESVVAPFDWREGWYYQLGIGTFRDIVI
jgi:broad specificity phosphatase PhoE